MSVIEKTVALLDVLTLRDVQALRPADRANLAAKCRRLAELAEPRPEPPKGGVLSDLKQGARYE